jgi:lipopolysaccharide cholinephosphotransferase
LEMTNEYGDANTGSRAQEPIDTAELRALQFGLLREFDSICRRQGLRYFLWAGTLLGAVRHQGFIPWDDDIDVAMPRTDYERLVQMDQPSGTSDRRLRVSEGSKDAYPYPYAKYMMEGTLHLEKHAAAIPLGVHIDVFPLDGLPAGSLSRRFRRVVSMGIQHLFSIKAAARGKRRGKLVQLYVTTAQGLMTRVPVGWLVKLDEKWARRTSFDTASWVGCFVWGNREEFKRGEIVPPSSVKFEGRMFPAPNYPHSVLSRTYGDYLRLPPVAQRVTHHDFEAYRLAAPGSGPVS